MTKLRLILTTCAIVGLLTASSLAQGPQDQGGGNGNANQVRQPDGVGDQQPNGSGNVDCRQDGTGDGPAVDCEGAGPLHMGHGQGGGRGGQMPWRQAQQDRLNRQALGLE